MACSFITDVGTVDCFYDSRFCNGLFIPADPQLCCAEAGGKSFRDALGGPCKLW